MNVGTTAMKQTPGDGRQHFSTTIARALNAFPGSTARVAPPNLGDLYAAGATNRREVRNPVIAIPGILGSRLVAPETGRIIWGAFGGEYADPSSAAGARLMALPMEEGVPLRDLGRDVRVDGALDRVRLKVFGLPVTLRAYAQMLCGLGAGGYRDEQLGHAGVYGESDEPYTCFQFAYDWRRDIVENATRLHEFILEKQAYVQHENEKRYGSTSEVRFDILAYSMGGLLTRYYLRYGAGDLPTDGSLPKTTWEGARFVERAILVGTPNAGSMEALSTLVKGQRFSPFHAKYQPALMGTMPSIYQLLPRSRHGAIIDAAESQPIDDLLSPELWEQMGWGLAAPGQDAVLRLLLPGASSARERRRIALDHQRKCLHRARHVQGALDAPGERTESVDLCLFAGAGVPTPATAAVNRANGSLKVTAHGPGDGTVLRSSALLDERVGKGWTLRLDSPVDWSYVNFLYVDHLKLTKVQAFTDNVLYLLLDDPRVRCRVGARGGT